LISSPDTRGSWTARFAPDSIVARTTLSILALSIVLGLIFAAGASMWVQREEEARLQVSLREALSTVDGTVRIACFLGDATLAREIAQGLLTDHSVTAVRIVAGGSTLYESSHAAEAAAIRSAFRVVSRKVYSPFAPTDQVGEIFVYPSDAQIHSQALRYSANAALVLALQVALVAASVALVVFLLVTRPIRGISDELHRLQLHTGMRLRIPRGNESDEIGRLVSDVNSLIGGLTALLDRERALRTEHEVQERKMKLIFDKAETGIFIMDENGVVQSWNPAFARILGLNEPPAGAGPWRLGELLGPNGSAVAELMQRAITSGQPGEVDLEISPAEAPRQEWIALSLSSIAPATLEGIVNDITERKRTELSARRVASHDALTGLLNRDGLAGVLADLFGDSSSKRRSELAMLQIDLDYFKQVNDTYGHEAGDRVLCHVARALQDTLRRSDVLGRQGGDEFMAILVGIGTPAKAQELANNLIAKISQPIDVGDGNYAHVSASIGIAFPDGPAETAEAVLRRADAAMYEAKGRGRSRACIAPSRAVRGSSSAASRGATLG
jgi:diguanylate cyclase (GGDEF)-like protein/PAS domain S-box-containing protein